jgi:hypothetical protein
MIKSIPGFLLSALLFSVLTLTASAQTQAGAIKAVRIEGDVQKLLADGTQVVVTEGALITEKDTLVTGAKSSVVLVFMNGSTVHVGATTRLSIDEFSMDPFSEDIEPSKLTKEPSVSRTSLNVAYGEVVGNVKKLAKGSSYNVHTPVGAAGIRGTTFSVKLVPVTLPGGQTTYNITLSTAEGVVLFTAVAPAGVTPTTAEVSAGTAVNASIEVTVSPAGTATATPTATATVAPVGTISPEATATINSVAAFVQAAVQNVVITQVQAQQAATEAAAKTATPAEVPATTPPPAPVNQTEAVKSAVTPPTTDTTTPNPIVTDLRSVSGPG